MTTNNIDPPYAGTPTIGIATLTSATPVTSRANITGVTGLVQLTAAPTGNGNPISSIVVKAKATSVATIISIWMYNGTTSFLYDEIDIPVQTAGNTNDSAQTTHQYQDLVLPSGYQLYVSQTVQSDCNVFAFGGNY